MTIKGSEWDGLVATHDLGKILIDENPLFQLTKEKELTQFAVEWTMPLEVIVRGKGKTPVQFATQCN
jgi:hypothetical protein